MKDPWPCDNYMIPGDSAELLPVQQSKEELADLEEMRVRLRKATQQPLFPDMNVPTRPFTSDDWGTPLWVAAGLVELWGEVALDPCSNEWSSFPAKTKVMLPNDGLAMDWDSFETMFCNPPYSKPKPWVERCAARGQRGLETITIVPETVMLLKHDHTTEWWPPVKTADLWLLPDKRIKYETPGGAGGAMWPSVLPYWGKKAKQFRRIFGRYGHVLDPSK